MLMCLDQRTGAGCTTENKDGAQFCRQCGRPLRFALQLRNPGEVVGAYCVVSVIGHGGFGAVYLAEALQQPGQRVALKETFDPDQIQSYQAELAVLARLQHPHLPRYHTVFEADGNGYLVMEYVPGQSLQEVLDRQQGPLLEAQVLGYAIQLCDALAFLHSQNPPIVHRDIKPANVRLTPEGLIKLVDFGLVKEGSGATRSSRQGVTPAYAPPEQWGLGGQHTDARIDLYALGATLYHLLTGQEPPVATDRISATPDPLAAPRAVNRSISDAVSGAVTGAMAMSVIQRPADALSLKRLLFQQGVASVALAAPQPFVPPSSQVVIPSLPIQQPTMHGKLGIEWITIPAGGFLMGSDRSRDKFAWDNETPQFKLSLPEFRISNYPITNAQYCAFITAIGHHPPINWKDGHIPVGKGRHPVLVISCLDALAFCQWADARLPTEAEWEKAARGIDGREYPWGDDLTPTKANSYDSKIDGTTPVCCFPNGQSPNGCLDMVGNVREWTISMLLPYLYQHDAERENPIVDGNLILRGGTWYSSMTARAAPTVKENLHRS